MRTKEERAERERLRSKGVRDWIKKNGPLPRDEKGRVYQLHHKDRNWRNNSLDNLQCVSRAEHEQIHLAERIQVAKQLTPFLNGNQFGKANAGKVRSVEARAKVSAARLGQPMNERTKHKIALANLGKNKGRKKSPSEIARREQTKAAKRAGDVNYGRCCTTDVEKKAWGERMSARAVIRTRLPNGRFSA